MIGQSKTKNGNCSIHSTNTFRESREPQALSSSWCCDVFLTLFSFGSLHRQNTRRPVRFPVKAAVFLCGSFTQTPEEGGGVRVELRMRLFAAQGKGGGALLRGWWLCKRGFWLLVAKAAWPRRAAAGGQVRVSKPPVEKPACGPAVAPRGKVASSLGRGYLGAGIPRHLATGVARGPLSKQLQDATI